MFAIFCKKVLQIFVIENCGLDPANFILKKLRELQNFNACPDPDPAFNFKPDPASKIQILHQKAKLGTPPAPRKTTSPPQKS
jgi:hypothetical protein